MNCPLCNGAGVVRTLANPDRDDPWRHQQDVSRICPRCYGGDLDAYFAQVDADIDAAMVRAAKASAAACIGSMQFSVATHISIPRFSVEHPDCAVICAALEPV